MEPKPPHCRCLCTRCNAQVDCGNKTAVTAEDAMSQTEINALEHAGRTAMVWSSDGYDGRTHYGDVIKALVPAMILLSIATALLLTIL